ncbi:glycosyltransferase [Echria macrotheca]|uniref:UDP-N-acetylglucosamine transferase subunit ALG14 n=1 Tax=Echria macrotheca TaxID=438768 RepID=A0AAJ0BNL2_9PEZI|nr:glycosyltransferase [Echria macrotheca]
MIETVKRKFRGNPRQHRRYIVTTGDNASRNMILELEIKIRDAHPDDRSGTFDVFEIQRARAVHQSMWTAPFTCLLAAAHAINALTSEPKTRPKDRYGFEYKYPHVIITNGPATGFIVGLVAHLLKILAVVPKNRLKMVYIESWARSRTLSLTGKLYLWTGIANMFCVQHESLANRIRGAQYVGIVAARTTPVG